jgi:hypothetical protein
MAIRSRIIGFSNRLTVHALACIILVPAVYPQSPPASSNTPTLILVHGRDQPIDKRDQVEAEWQAAVSAGVSQAGRPNLIPQSKRRFVWYADLLEPGARGCPFADPGAASAYKAAGISKLPSLRDFFTHLAEGLNNQQQRALANVIVKDVEAYLGNGSAACAVDERLRNAIGDGAAGQRLPAEAPVVIVAHSLGSMVTYKNLMNRLADTQRPVYLVTIGSMLGERVVQQTLLGSHAAFPAKVPLPVKAWWNIVNTQDRLAFTAAPAFASNFPAKRPRDIQLDLGGPDAHSVTRYLSSRSGGRAITEAWCAGSPSDTGCKPR